MRDHSLIVDSVIKNIIKELLKISEQALSLAEGLQNVAPEEKSNPSVQYLFETTEQIGHAIEKLKQLFPPHESIYHSASKPKP
jgi:hypothetical protein